MPGSPRTTMTAPDDPSETAVSASRDCASSSGVDHAEKLLEQRPAPLKVVLGFVASRTEAQSDPDALFTLRNGKSRGPQVLRVLWGCARASLRLRLRKRRGGPVLRGLRASAGARGGVRPPNFRVEELTATGVRSLSCSVIWSATPACRRSSTRRRFAQLNVFFRQPFFRSGRRSGDSPGPSFCRTRSG